MQLWADSKPLCIPVQTAYKSFTKSCTWNEWLELPFPISSLPLTAQLAITIWDLSPLHADKSVGTAIPFGGTSISLFAKDDTLQKGRQKCKVYRHKTADGSSSTTTPAFPPPRRRDQLNKDIVDGRSVEEEELDRLEKLLKKLEMEEIPRNDWLDAMVFRQIEKLQREADASLLKRRRQTKSYNGITNGDAAGEDDVDELFTLLIDFPRFDFPIVFTDYEYTPTPISSLAPAPPAPGSVNLKPPPEVQYAPGINRTGDGIGDESEGAGPLIRIYDPEVGAKDNPAENKHRRLVRSHRTGVLDRDLKPNAKIRDELNTIMSYGPTQELNTEEKDLVWKFRHHLTRDKRALTKFVKSVSWQEQGEAKQAVQLLPKWTEIDVDDALELLGPSFDNPAVRAYAVDRLRESDDDELLLYLLQLVQALKFERIAENTDNSTHESSLARFLISRATQNFTLGNYLHWYLMVECDDRSVDQKEVDRKLFARVEFDFMAELSQMSDGPERRQTLLRQGEFITLLSRVSKEIRFSREDRPKKLHRLKKYLSDPKNELLSFDPLPLPLDPSIQIIGCFPDDSNVFKSSLYPLLINLKTLDNKKYPVLFKTGDDLRQDQLVIQIISLMDRLLLKENLDLKLSPYRILATSATAGAVQFMPSMSLAGAAQKYRGSNNSILAYLKANNPDSHAELGVRKEAIDTYVKSCAGYCVITYLLGVGDRHLDNLLLAPDGHFFHADFGYILGRDPKPFAPLMKITPLMVDAFGGTSHPNFALFKQLSFTAYTTLRKSSNLILNLFSLMRDANVQDIKAEPDKSVEKVRERFHLEMSEEEVVRWWGGLVEDSLGGLGGAVIDVVHNMMQGLRA